MKGVHCAVLGARMVLLLLGCSDYMVSGIKDDPGADDTSSNTGTGETGLGTGDYTDEDPDVCEEQDLPAEAIEQGEECFLEGTPVGSFTPVVEWKKNSFSVQSGSNQVMMMPAVGSLTDDDGDGDADEDDIPDIVFITYGSATVIRVVSGDGGREILNVQDNTVQGQGGVALGDIDLDGWTDIVAATTSGLVAYDHRGNKIWTSSNLSGHIYGTCDNPAISDMNHDGKPEIILGRAVVSNSGRLLATGPAGMGGVNGNNVGTTAFAVDIDGDGQEEVVTGNSLFHMDGSVVWQNREQDGYVAVGNFDSDPKGEIVVSNAGQVRLQDDDGRVLCTNRIPGADSGYYGGPPTIADFNGDGEAEFALAAGSRYSVFDKNCSVLWQATTQDASSGNTGSSVFDFEGDGVAEAVYGDEIRLWVFSGPDGSVKLESRDHTNATWLEYPVVADIDSDGHAEIVVPNTSNFGGGQQEAGITVIGDANNSWRSGRKIWNQHAYFITNINEDGSIPATAPQNWLSYNNFRSGDIGAGTEGYSAPDLVGDIRFVCNDECDQDRLYVWVTLGNRGYEDIEADFPVELIGVLKDGTEVSLVQETITDTIPAGQRLEGMEWVIEGVPSELKALVLKVDGGDNASRSLVEECVEDNNTDEWRDNLCK